MKATSVLSATQVAEKMAAAARNSLRRLEAAKYSGGLALLIVVAGSATALIVGEAPPAATSPYVTVIVDGKASCGQLMLSPSSTLMAGETSLASGVSALVVVPGCPKPRTSTMKSTSTRS